ncbi:DUF979 domain-containing protein [Actinoallomurus iriomotensis]|uniref:Membrane protein n=1 Tax=Actinoallomurus iriomotensis TaxID=478107 RepID=A0A9W6VJR4_9ACTN|nr:DUF979 domain-containing protein [Actinoallomurus iriomotensis]GLY74363.1 membrane protein [Actinoallomurus iriomotensis]
MIKVEWFYWLCGAIFLAVAVLTLADRTNAKRYGSAAFWGLLGAAFVYSTFAVHKTAPAWVLGLAVIAMALLVATGRLGRGTTPGPTRAEQEAGADRFGNRLFVPALTIPVVVIIFAVGLAKIHTGAEPLLEKSSETLIGLGVAAIVAVLIGFVMLRPKSPLAPLNEGRRLLEAIGWAAVLPQMLATLGQLFVAAGVGTQVGRITENVLPGNSLIGGVIVYCVGMALFTIVMGNAFAAFPIMTAAIGYPVLVQHFHGDAAAVFAIGMLAGFCGTLCTPMAANFNIVPAALLEMKDKYGPIKAQIPTAIPLLACNIILMYALAF